MSRVRTLQLLIENAGERLAAAKQNADQIRREIDELKQRLRQEQEEAEQLFLPLKKPTRGLSEKWALVLSFMVVRAPNPTSVDEIHNFTSASGLAISRAALRAQLHNYEKRGLIERVSDGLYVATAIAHTYCDY